MAKVYDTFLTLSGFKRGVENFLDRLDFGFDSGAKLLDAGCGTGLMALYLARRFPRSEITAFDIDRTMLRYMELQIGHGNYEAQNIIVAKGDLNNTNRLHILKNAKVMILPAENFDAVFVSGALEHVPLTETVVRLAKLIKPGGIFFNLGVRRNPTGAVLGMVYRFRPYGTSEMRRACELAGLEDIRIIQLSVEDFPANLSRIAVMARKGH